MQAYEDAITDPTTQISGDSDAYLPAKAEHVDQPMELTRGDEGVGEEADNLFEQTVITQMALFGYDFYKRDFKKRGRPRLHLRRGRHLCLPLPPEARRE